MEQSILDQDILLDTIKEYRKILEGLIEMIRESSNNDCQNVIRDFDRDLLEELWNKKQVLWEV